MLLDFGNFQDTVDLDKRFGYIQGLSFNATGGPGGVPCVETTEPGGDNSFNNGFYLGFPSYSRSGVCGLHTNMSVADPDGWALMEVWQGDYCVGVYVVDGDLQVWHYDALEDTDEMLFDAPFTASTYQWIEFGWTLSSLDPSNSVNRDGSVELKIDHVSVGDITGIPLGYNLNAGWTRDVQWNVVIANPHGKCDMYYLLDGSGSQETTFLGTGIAMQAIDINFDDTGYYEELDTDSGELFSSESSKKSTFTHDDFSSIGSKVVRGLKHTASGYKTDAGFRRFLSMMRRDEFDKFSDTYYPIGIGDTLWMSSIWEVDPYTERRFLVGDINLTEFGILIG